MDVNNTTIKTCSAWIKLPGTSKVYRKIAMLEDVTFVRILVISYSMLLIVGFLGNILILVIYPVNKRHKRNIEIELRYLAIVDFLVCVYFSGTRIFLLVFKIDLAGHYWSADYVICNVTWRLSGHILLFIIIHRCIIVMKPFTKQLTIKQIRITILLLFVLVILSLVPESICYLLSGGTRNKLFYNAVVIRIVMHVIRLVTYFCVVIITTILDFAKLQNNRKVSVTANQQITLRNKKAMKIVTVTAIAFIIFTFPNEIVYTIRLHFPNSENASSFCSTKKLHEISEMYKVINNVVNVFIYAGMDKLFRQKLTLLIKKLLYKKQLEERESQSGHIAVIFLNKNN